MALLLLSALVCTDAFVAAGPSRLRPALDSRRPSPVSQCRMSAAQNPIKAAVAASLLVGALGILPVDAGSVANPYAKVSLTSNVVSDSFMPGPFLFLICCSFLTCICPRLTRRPLPSSGLRCGYKSEDQWLVLFVVGLLDPCLAEGQAERCQDILQVATVCGAPALTLLHARSPHAQTHTHTPPHTARPSQYKFSQDGQDQRRIRRRFLGQWLCLDVLTGRQGRGQGGPGCGTPRCLSGSGLPILQAQRGQCNPP